MTVLRAVLVGLGAGAALAFLAALLGPRHRRPPDELTAPVPTSPSAARPGPGAP